MIKKSLAILALVISISFVGSEAFARHGHDSAGCCYNTFRGSLQAPGGRTYTGASRPFDENGNNYGAGPCPSRGTTVYDRS